MTIHRILAISGSLRAQSFNSAILREAVACAPSNLEIVIYGIQDIPLYNKDVELKALPNSVADLREEITQAAGLLIATPEYNHSVPGVLKNTIDWVSRPPGNVFNLKPIGIMGVSDGRFATVRAQIELRKILGQSRNGLIMNQPALHIANGDDKFDENLKLTDNRSQEQLAKFMVSFGDWIERFSK